MKELLNKPPAWNAAPIDSMRSANSTPVRSPAPSERSLPVSEARPFFAAGSRIAPASMINLPSTTGSVCFSTRITLSPFESVNCSTFGKAYGRSGPGVGGVDCALATFIAPVAAIASESAAILVVIDTRCIISSPKRRW
jgi:hypothetical protein